MINSSNDEPTSSLIHTLPIDRAEQRRQRDKERFAQMSNDKKNEQRAVRRAAYQRTAELSGKECTLNNKYGLLLHRIISN